MNYVHCQSTSMCDCCEAELHEEEIHAVHSSLCISCGDSLQADLDAERAAEADGAPCVHLVVASPSLVKIIDRAQQRARQLLGEKFGAAS